MAVNKPDPVRNLGHKATQAETSLTGNPARMVDYAQNNASGNIVRGPARSQGTYKKFADPQSGISSQQNLDRWSGLASANSYRRGPGPGVPATTPDPRPGRRASQESDNYLASTKGWPRFESGSDTGPGRIEKANK